MARGNRSLELHGSVRITAGARDFGGERQIALLDAIAASGSITRAAKAIGMSYKAAWDAVDAMNGLAGEPLVERSTGGRGGGGTRLTERGQRLVDNFRIIEREHRRFVELLNLQARSLADDYFLVKAMGMRTSARNQFFGKVGAIRRGSVNDEVTVQVAGGHAIVAIVTHESRENLGLRAGMEAYALVKSSSVIVVTGGDGARYSARNCLAGTVSRVLPGAVNSEVRIELPGGLAVAAIITNESRDALALEPGNAAAALFKASSVIIGVPG
ncbi:MAG: TOBE domain-containing protein [Steroidobacteraceae bacterium]